MRKGYIALLARDGNLTMVGAPDKPLPVAAFEAHERMTKSDVKYRFSIDMVSLKGE